MNIAITIGIILLIITWGRVWYIETHNSEDDRSVMGSGFLVTIIVVGFLIAAGIIKYIHDH